MSIKITIPNTSSDVLTFGSANTPTAAQIAGIDSGSSNGQLALYTTASGTSTERMRIDSSGSVGIGTSSPAYKLDVVVASNKRVVAFTPTSSSGISDFSTGGVGWNFTRPDDGAFRSSIFSYNTAADAKNNFAIQARADMVFATGGDFSTSTERMRIDNSGNLLVGTTSARAPLTVQTAPSSSAYGQIAAFSAAASDVGNAGISVTKYDNVTTTSQVFARFLVNQGSTASGQINANGASAAAFGGYSDSRLKENIVDLPSQLDNIMALRTVEFDYIESEGGGHQIGFIAQEVQEIYPDLIGEREDGMLTLTDLNKNDARLIKAIQEMKAIIDTQASTITSLTDRITALEGATS